MSRKGANLNANKILHSIIRWGSIVLVILSIVLVALLSFVTDLGLSPSVRSLTTVAIVGVVLNYLIWDTFYKDQYTGVMSKDIEEASKGKYSIHKRYYDARKGFTQEKLREQIRSYNQSFLQAWLNDVEDITGRKIEEMRKGKYYGNTHKILIWRIKHRIYPKSGIKTPRQLLNILSVGKSENMKIKTNSETAYRNIHRVSKLFTSICGMFFAASLVYQFISEGWQSAIIQMVISVALIFASLFFGSMSGLKGAQIKLSIAEEICTLLEEWKAEEPVIEKYDVAVDEKIVDDDNKNKEIKPVKHNGIEIV